MSNLASRASLVVCMQESLPSETRKSLVSGVGRGTLGYASPEQSEGHGGRASDVYSIGATLVYASGFKRPFPGFNELGIGRAFDRGVFLPCLSILLRVRYVHGGAAVALVAGGIIH